MIGLLQYFGAAQALAPWINQTSVGEAFANLRQRNQFATLTNVALAALLWWVEQERFLVSKLNVQASSRWLVMLTACILAFGNAASSSRTGLLQTGLLVLLLGIWGGLHKPRVHCVLMAFGLTYVTALVLLPSLTGMDPLIHGAWARMRTGDAVCASRLTLWSNVLQLIAQKPWFGWGWGELDYAHYTTLYDGPRFCDLLDNAHNLPLHLAVELGVPAALFFCGGVLWWIFRLQPWCETDATRQLAWAVLALIGLHSLLEYPLWYGPFQMAVGLCVLMLWRGNHSVGDQKLKKNWALAHIYRALVAIFLIVMAGYAAWDYHRISQIYLAPQARAAAYREDTLAKIRNSWLFANQVSFAELSLTPLTQANAQWTFATAKALLHYSPEPRVIEKVIESAVMLGRDDEALLHLARYRAAFPQAHAKWREAKGLMDGPED
ncbi:PglL family O-oligosaccharyltransferase [Polaromonas sp. UC242_47]|uniref:PglL family O-oligosaccharyltransferase n=1 Tax=Polaromonas sp. UC242_47 TaxID=3374626 RepID=UPI0037BABF3D